MRYLSVLILVLLMQPAMAHAFDTVIISYTCPVDGTTFSIKTGGPSFDPYDSGQMLDSMPSVGYEFTYSSWPVAQCPNDGMVMFKKEDFTMKEISILKDYIPTPEYKQMLKKHNIYWRAAKLQEKIGVPLNERWPTMLKATWRAKSDQYDFYATETIKAIEVFLADPPKDLKEKAIENCQLLLGELYRRVGDFDKAKAIFEDLMTRPTFKNQVFFSKVIAYQLELIAKKDKSSHNIMDMTPIKKS